MRNAYKVLVGKPEGKRSLGRPRRRWEANIKTVINKKGCEYIDWILVAQDTNMWRALVAMIALMMEAANASETSVNFYQTTQCNNPEDSDIQF
jgi:hypothetical protein